LNKLFKLGLDTTIHQSATTFVHMVLIEDITDQDPVPTRAKQKNIYTRIIKRHPWWWWTAMVVGISFTGFIGFYPILQLREPQWLKNLMSYFLPYQNHSKVLFIVSVAYLIASIGENMKK